MHPFVILSSSLVESLPEGVDSALKAMDEFNHGLLETDEQARSVNLCGHLCVYTPLSFPGWVAPVYYECPRTIGVHPLPPANYLEHMPAGTPPAQGLSKLSGNLLSNPSSVHDLAPPFCGIVIDRLKRRAIIQIDGLGAAQVYRYQSRMGWAITNRPFLIRALGLSLTIDWENAIAALSMGWFHDSHTLFHECSQLSPGERLVIDERSLRSESTGSLEHWIDKGLSHAGDIYETVSLGLVGYMDAIAALSKTIRVRFSGGWDSRAILALIGKTSLADSCRLAVKGHSSSSDVVRAKEAAHAVGWPISNESTPEQLPASKESLFRSVSQTIRWQSMSFDHEKHKTLFASQDRLPLQSASLMGHHGEILRRDMWGGRFHSGTPRSKLARHIIKWRVRKSPPLFRDLAQDVISQAMNHLCGYADDVNMQGLQFLDLFNILQRDRRANMGSTFGQPNFVFTPFFHPNCIIASFSGVAKDRSPLGFHEYLIRRHQPQLMEIPIATAENKNHGTSPYYDSRAFWAKCSVAWLRHQLDSVSGHIGAFASNCNDEQLLRSADAIVILSGLCKMLEGRDSIAQEFDDVDAR